ncbi:MAG: (2Fe-2S) ferredoxin domain-containing protein [Deltaproteobacteria bacterium]|nr:(2Fe-2S) ferredoxin domain-containing protein [Deltaproteobacteria bacterium]
MTRRHLFICTNPRASGKPACGERGVALVAAVQNLLIARGTPEPRVTSCGCLGPCFDGPNAVIYPDGPEGVWYARLDVADAPGLVDHLIHGIVAAKRVDPPGE